MTALTKPPVATLVSASDSCLNPPVPSCTLIGSMRVAALCGGQVSEAAGTTKEKVKLLDSDFISIQQPVSGGA